MTNAIIQKLQDEFNIPIERESQVVYILVEVRKLLDVEPKNIRSKYVTLQFFCDWALHVKLRKRNAGRLLRAFDEAYGRRGPDGMMLAEDQEALQNKVSLIEFTRELVEVLGNYGIAMNTLTGPYPWFRFIELYLSIIKDCALQYADQEVTLTHVNEVVVSIYEVPEEVQLLEPDIHMPFGIDWRFSLKGKPVFHWPMPLGAHKSFLALTSVSTPAPPQR